MAYAEASRQKLRLEFDYPLGTFHRSRPVPRRHVLHVSEILKWADAHFERTKKWPTVSLGRIPEPLDEKWCNIDQALRNGYRGFPGGWSLLRLLRKVDKRAGN